jgi:hypothetical protein
MTGIANTASERTELIFLSHSGADTQAAKDLAGLLRQGGVDVWVDVERLAPGDVWMDELEAALVGCLWRIVISQAVGHVTMLHPLAVGCSFQRSKQHA